MTYLEYCQFIQEHYQPLHPHLYTFGEEILVPRLTQAIRGRNPRELRSVSTEVHPGVHVFDMLQPPFCRQLLEEVASFEKWCDAVELGQVRPNTMNNYGTVLDCMGFEPFLQRLMLETIAPFASLFYADVGGDSLDTHHGFIVEYQIGKDTSLDFHVDASDVTLNVCLGTSFRGGELYFGGVRCQRCQETPPLPGEEFTIAHVPGRAILHRGKHRHAAKTLTAGERYNLIVWCNSTRHARRKDDGTCPAWCGRAGRKQDE